jgi:rare lipoprotein A
MPETTSYAQTSEEINEVRSWRLRRTAIAVALGFGLAAGDISASNSSDVKSGHENSIKTALDRAPTDRKTLRALLNAKALSPTVVGTASRYNPFREGGRIKTSSGERYDPASWTAAIRIDLRKKFGGVRFGKNYRATYALVECDDKRFIVRINDVGRLKRGRVIDLNKRSMRYCGPSPRIGLIHGVKITLLHGDDWTPGPVRREQPIKVAARQARAEDRPREPIESERPATIAADHVPVQDRAPKSIASEKQLNVATKQRPADERTPEPIVAEEPIAVAAEQVPADDPAPAPIGGEKPIDVAAIETPAAEQTPAPIADQKPTIIVTEPAPDDDRTPKPIDDAQPIIVAAAQVPDHDSMPAPVASPRSASATAEPHRNRYPPIKTEIAVAYSMVIAAVVVILRRPSAPPLNVPNAESDLLAACAGRRRAKQTSSRKSRRKSQGKKRAGKTTAASKRRRTYTAAASLQSARKAPSRAKGARRAAPAPRRR